MFERMVQVKQYNSDGLPIWNLISCDSNKSAEELMISKTSGAKTFETAILWMPKPQKVPLTKWVTEDKKVGVFFEPLTTELNFLAETFNIIPEDEIRFVKGRREYTDEPELIGMLDRAAEMGYVNEYIPEPAETKHYKIKDQLLNGLHTEKEIAIIQTKKHFQELYKKNKDFASEELAKIILLKEKIFTLKQDDKSEIWYYKTNKFVPDGKCLIEEYVRRYIGEEYKQIIVKNVIAKIEVDTYIDANEFFKEENARYIPLRNGVYDLKKRKLLKHLPKYKFFHTLPITYVEGAVCPLTIQFFKDVLKHENDLNLIQEFFGNLLLRNYKYAKAFMFIGEGSNGKSKALDLFRRFVGDENSESISLQQIARDKFITSCLWGKLLNACGDISDESLQSTDIFKELLGEDYINANRKYKTHIQFKNYAKLAFSANQLPQSRDMSKGFLRRWCILEFPFTFKKKLDYYKLSDAEKTNIKLADENILDKIQSDAEISGLFNWALKGLERLQSNGGFSESDSLEELKNIWLRKSNSVNAFILDEVIEDYESQIEKGDFRIAYNQYCKKYKIPIGTDKNIKFALREMGCEEQRVGKKIGDDWTTTHIWKGIKLKSQKQLSHNSDIGDSLEDFDVFDD
jgi:P4 family phage/plasmid primase-like protien